MRGLPDLLRRAAATDPGRVAVEVEGEGTLTYGEWERRSSAMARGLQAVGVDVGDRVVLLGDLPGWGAYAVSYLAVHKAGAVAVPLSAGVGVIELDRIVRDLGPAAVLAAPGLGPLEASTPTIDPAELEDRGRDAEPLPAGLPEPGEILCASHPLSRPVYLSRPYRALLSGPSLTFDDAARPSLLHTFAPGTLAGQDALCAALQPIPVRSVVLADFDPDRLCAVLAARAIPACGLPPPLARALLDTGATARHDLSRVQRVVLASGRVSPTLLTRLSAAFPRAALRLVDVLGHPPELRTVFAHDRRRPGALGRPVQGTAVEVTDEAGRAQGRGGLGLVRVRGLPAGGQGPEQGDGAGSGATAAGWVATDELGYLDETGALYVVKTRSDVVSCRRSLVARAEVEGVLCEHPAVAHVAVLGVPEEGPHGRLAAVVALASPATASQLQAVVRRRLGDDKAPESVFFVDEVPRTASGTILRAQLERSLGLVVEGDEQLEVSTPVQESVAAVWRRVLGREEVGPGDDFFELGGTGSAAAAVLGLLEDALEVTLPPSALLAEPTVGGLSRVVERLASCGDGPPAPPPVAFSQEGMLWHELFAPGCQNLPGLARRYRGPLDVEALGRALDEITRRHEALRTTFALRDGRPVQVVHPHRPLGLSARDLTGLAPEERETTVERVVSEAGRTPFDLVEGPLFTPTLLRLASDDHVLVIRTHHSVFDDWSVGVFRRELAALYAAYGRGERSPLAELPVPFAELCRRQRRALAGPTGTRELAFWRRELAGAPLATQLPVGDPDLPEGAPQPAGRPVSVTLPPEISDRLRAVARSERVTVFMALLAAFGVLVQRRTGQDDLLLATVVANRNRTELEGPIGCFTKKVPLRLRLGGDPAFTEVLIRARGALLGALSHQDLPFETVIGDVLGAPAAAHGLVPHVAVMFQGVTPAQELVLPGVETTGFQTSATASRAHFMARDAERPGPPDDVRAAPWGAGLYLGTFVILSVADSGDELSFTARGAFHAPAVRELLDGFAALLAEVAADPARRLSGLAAAGRQQTTDRADSQALGSPGEIAELRGFRVDLARVRQALAGCPGVRDVTVSLEGDEGAEPAMVASVVPAARAPTLAGLRAFLWARLPGYAWPSALRVVECLSAEQGTAAPADGVETQIVREESLLGALWGEVLGVEHAAPAESYSQVFSFTQALARAREAGVTVPGEPVTRNRTVRTLAAALAARRQPSGD